MLFLEIVSIVLPEKNKGVEFGKDIARIKKKTAIFFFLFITHKSLIKSHVISSRSYFSWIHRAYLYYFINLNANPEETGLNKLNKWLIDWLNDFDWLMKWFIYWWMDGWTDGRMDGLNDWLIDVFGEIWKRFATCMLHFLNIHEHHLHHLCIPGLNHNSLFLVYI